LLNAVLRRLQRHVISGSEIGMIRLGINGSTPPAFSPSSTMKAVRFTQSLPARPCYQLTSGYRANSTVAQVAITAQRGRNLTPWLRAMKEIRERGDNPPNLPRAALTPKHMNDSHYAAKLPFSTDEVLLFSPNNDRLT
jgi:hypothetical protein